jgi:hypothetical protein
MGKEEMAFSSLERETMAEEMSLLRSLVVSFSV